MKNKTLEQIYRFKVEAEIPYFESRYYAKKFLDERVPKYLIPGSLIKRTTSGFVIMVLRPFSRGEVIEGD